MTEQFPVVRLASVQAAPVWLDKAATIDKACSLIAEAGRGGAQLVGFPENFVPGYPAWFFFHPATSAISRDFSARLFMNSMEIPGPETSKLCAAARGAGAYVVIGVTERRPDTTGTLFNTQLFIDPSGAIVGKHQKLVPTISERLVHSNGLGGTMRSFESPFGPVSGLLCGENSNPLAIAVLCAEYTRIHVASWPNNFIPSYAGMCESSLLASRSLAYMTKAFVISSCGINSEEMIDELAMTEADRDFMSDTTKTGGSAIVDPMGTVVAGPLPGGEEGILFADANLEAAIAGRFVHDFGGHYNRADVFSLTVSETPGSVLTRRQGAPTDEDGKGRYVNEDDARQQLGTLHQHNGQDVGPTL